MKLLGLVSLLLAPCSLLSQQTTALVDATTYEFKRPTTAQVVSGNGLITAATVNGYFADPSTNGSFSASAWRSDLGLVIGTNVQAYSANLTSWAAVTRASGFDTFTATPSGANLASLLTSALPASKGGTGLTALGTGVATALGVNTGSAGAFVVYNAALGTPTAGDISNAALTYRTATTSVRGGTLLATTAEALAGTDTAKTVVPSGLDARALLGTLTRQIKDSLYSDGATSARAAYWTHGAAGALASLPGSIPIELQVPTSNPAAAVVLFTAHTSLTPSVSTANTLVVSIDTSGGLVIRQNGAVGGTDYRIFTYAGFRAAYSGLWLRGMIVFSAGDSTTAPLVYLQGVDSSASFSLTTNGTVPNWMPSTLSSTYYLSGYGFTAGRFIPHGPILGALTAAEVLEWTQTGRLPTWCEIGTGSAVDKAVDGDFATDPTAVASPNTWTLDSGVTWDAANFELDFATAGSAWARTQSSSGASVWLRAGQRYLVKFTIKNYVSGTLVLANGSLVTFSVAYGSNGASANGTYAYEVLPTIDTRVCFGSSSALNLSLDDVKVYVLGPIFKPVMQPGVTLRDSGTNNLPGILTSGITPITMGDRGAFTATLTWSGTHEGKSLLGAQALPSNAIVTRIWRKATVASSGSGCTIGTTTSATRWQALDTYTTAAELSTLANSLPAGTAANDLDIVVDPDTANYTGSITVTVEYQIVGGTP